MNQAQKFSQFVRGRILEDSPDSIRIEGESLIVTHRFTVHDTSTASDESASSQRVCPMYEPEQRS
jgi:hypothetical protein